MATKTIAVGSRWTDGRLLLAVNVVVPKFVHYTVTETGETGWTKKHRIEHFPPQGFVRTEEER